MATANLPSTGSIVDYLRSSGQDASYSARRKLYNDSGLGTRLGDFVGSSGQNLALLKQLQSKPTTPTPTPTATPALDTVRTVGASTATKTSTPMTATGVVTQAQQPQTVASRLGVPESTISAPKPSSSAMSVQDIINKATGVSVAPNQSVLPIPTAPQTAPAAAAPTATSTTPAASAPQSSTGGTIAAGNATVNPNTLIPDGDTGERDLVSEWLNSEEGQLFTARQELAGMDAEAAQEEARAELEAKYEGEKATLEENLAANGLAFSGVRATKVKALADSLASSLIGVDRKFASKLLDANLDLREAILKGVADIAAEAKAGRKEAIDQLNAVGWAVIGDQLVPTLAARSAERADVQLAMSERRLQLAEESASRAEARFEQLYGAGKVNGFQAVQELIALNPAATEADIRSTVRSNPTIFGDLSQGELDDAVALAGMPPALQETVAESYVKSFDDWKTSRGTAKEKAKAALDQSGGRIEVKGSDGKSSRIYTLTTDQLESVKSIIDLME